MARATLDKQLRAFKRIARGTVERTLADDGDARLFRPTQCKLNALEGVGILGRLPSISGSVCVSDEEQRALAMALSKLTRTASAKTHDDFINFKVKLIPHILKLRGKAGWDSTIPILTDNGEGARGWGHLFEEKSMVPAPEAAFFKCPSCIGVESSLRANFQRRDLDQKIKCPFCGKGSPSRKWKCTCGQPWHACETHKYSFKAGDDDPCPDQPSKGQPFQDASRAPHKRKVSKTSLVEPDAVIADDNRRAKAIKAANRGVKRKADIILGDRPSVLRRPTLLGPILKERFMGGSSSASS